MGEVPKHYPQPAGTRPVDWRTYTTAKRSRCCPRILVEPPELIDVITVIGLPLPAEGGRQMARRHLAQQRNQALPLGLGHVRPDHRYDVLGHAAFASLTSARVLQVPHDLLSAGPPLDLNVQRYSQ